MTLRGRRKMLKSSKDLICVFCGEKGMKKAIIFNGIKEFEVVKCTSCGKYLTQPEFICTNYDENSIIDDWEYLPKEEPKDEEPDIEIDAEFDENGELIVKEIRERKEKK